MATQVPGKRVSDMAECTDYDPDDLLMVIDTSASQTKKQKESVMLNNFINESIGYVFIIDPDATDQGNASEADTIAEALASLAANDSAILLFRHTGASATTTYTISTSIGPGVFPNVRFQFQQGAILSIDAAKSFSAYSANSIIASPDQQIFSGSGTILFSTGGEKSACWWGMSTSASEANNLTYLNAAIASGEGPVLIPIDGTIPIDPGVTVNKTGVVLKGLGSQTTVFDVVGDVSAGVIFTLGSSTPIWYSGIEDIGIIGNSYTQTGITVNGAKLCWLKNVEVEECKIGIKHTNEDDYDTWYNILENCKVENCKPADGNGRALWINTNSNDIKIIGGSYKTSDVLLEIGNSAIVAAGDVPYGITFLNTSFEDGASSIIGSYFMLLNGRYVSFFGGRFEITGGPYDFYVDQHSDTISIVDVINVAATDPVFHAASTAFLYKRDTNNGVKIYGGPGLNVERTSVTGEIAKCRITADANYRFVQTADGSMYWKSGVDADDFMALYRINTTIDLAVAATKFTVYTVPSNYSFLPVTVQWRCNTDITATNGDYIGVGVDAADRRVDYGVNTSVAASNKHAKNKKFRWINSSELTNQIADSGEVISLMSVNGTTDGAALSNNIGGAGQTILVLITGWLVRNISSVA